MNATTAPDDPRSWFSQFGIVPEVYLPVLAAALENGADDADLYFEHSTSTSVVLADNKVNRASTSVDLGVGVRVVIGDQVGYAFTEDLSPEAMKRAARVAAQIARSGARPAPVEVSYLDIPDFYPMRAPWRDVDMGARVPLLRTWEAKAFELDSRVQKVQASLADVDRHILVVKADGRVAADYQPMTRGAVACTAGHNGERESSSYNVAGRAGLEFYDEATQERMVREAVHRTLQLLDSGKPPAGEMTVVMAAGSSGILLHEAIGHGMEADFNRKRISIFADRVGKRIAPPEVTIVDDGTLPGARGSINIDDEGNPSQRTVLVEDGILRTYLHDGISSRHYGVEPTGSGRRESFRHPVLPRMRSTYLEPGPHSRDAIIASVKKGLYCESFQNGQVQIGAGDFAFYVRQAWLIEDGKLTQPVKDVNLIGNGPKVLETIEMVGDDFTIDEGGWTCGKDGQSVPVSQGMPTIKVSRLSVGGVST